jgi:hypothetical protein
MVKLAVNPNEAVASMNNSFDNWQAQSRTWNVSGFSIFYAIKSVKNSLNVFWRYTDTCVCYLDLK